MRPPAQCRHSPHTIRGPTRTSTEGPSGCVRTAPPRPCRHTPSRVSRSKGSSTESGTHNAVLTTAYS
eukprot:7231280-Pyramimonas_sp.AAC.1